MERRKKLNLTQLQKRIDKEIPEIAKKFSTQAKQMFLVGGALRDIVFGRAPTDFDFVISDIEKAKTFFKNEKIKFFTIEKGDFVFLRVVLKNKTLDFIKQEKPITEDIHDRDFTINTIFYNVKTKDLIGSHEAFEDIEAHILRVASENSIEKDPLRALRGIRFAANFNLKIEKFTAEKMKSGFSLLKNVSESRKHEELRKLFEIPFEKLFSAFCVIFPEICPENFESEIKKIHRCTSFGTSKKEISKGVSLTHLCKLFLIVKTFKLNSREIFGTTKKEEEFLDILDKAGCDFESLFEIFKKHPIDYVLAVDIMKCKGRKAEEIKKWGSIKIDGNKLKELYNVSGKTLGKIKEEKLKEECRKIYEEKV